VLCLCLSCCCAKHIRNLVYSPRLFDVYPF
jgi:hypothetical protein